MGKNVNELPPASNANGLRLYAVEGGNADVHVDVGVPNGLATHDALNEHIVDENPHPQYLTQSAGDARYEPVGALSAHVAAPHPHPEYLREAEAAELIRDTIAAALVAGSGIAITPDDAGDTITIAATGGGGSATALSNTTPPAPTAAGSAGTSVEAARGDHAHPLPATGSGIRVNGNTIEGAGAEVGDITATSYMLALADANRFRRCNNAAPQTITIPAQSTVAWPDGTQIEFMQYGAGAVTIAAGAGVTLRRNSALGAVSGGQYAVFGMKRIASDEWVVFGQMAAA